MKIYISDYDTGKVYKNLRIVKEYIEKEDELMRLYDYSYILYNPKIGKIFKEIRKDGTPIFTEKFRHSKLMNVAEAYYFLKYIRDFLYNHDKPYINKIVNPIDKYNSDLRVCLFNFI